MMEKKSNQYNWGAGIPIGIGIAFGVGLALNNFLFGIPVGFVMALAIASAYRKMDDKKLPGAQNPLVGKDGSEV
jgi:hypothetical protein